jgi:YesN/AraC family two-component response regulator
MKIDTSHLNPAHQVVQLIAASHPVSEKLKEDFILHCFVLKVPANYVLLEQGEICEAIYFVHTGLLRGFSTRNNEVLTSWITGENEFISSISGMYGLKPSKKSIHAVENSILIGIPNNVLLRWYDEFPEMNVVMRKTMESYYQDAEERAYISRLGTAHEKYQYFMDTKPNMINRVPSNHLASYLGMTEKTLIHIKKKFEEKASNVQTTIPIENIEKIIKGKELFKIKNLSMQDVATELDMTAHHLSGILNNHYQKRFTDYINSFRIEYAKNNLLNVKFNKMYTMDAVGSEAGFASRSSFFEVFKKHTGKSPSQYFRDIHLN